MKRYSNNEKLSFWQSYSDMMAALLLVFVLLISYTLLESKMSYESKEKELQQQQQELEKQRELANEQKEIMLEQQEKINGLIGVKSSIIKSLSDEFSTSDLKVVIDQGTGAITFDSSVLFDFNEYKLKGSGTKFLDEFLPRYLKTLLNGENRGYVAEIIIEGHTDTNGDYMSNLELSQKRAFSVSSYCLAEENQFMKKGDMDLIRKMLTANGKSWSSPVYNEDGTVNMDQSRRVEFKFRLKDEEMIEEMKSVLEKE